MLRRWIDQRHKAAIRHAEQGMRRNQRSHERLIARFFGACDGGKVLDQHRELESSFLTGSTVIRTHPVTDSCVRTICPLLAASVRQTLDIPPGRKVKRPGDRSRHQRTERTDGNGYVTFDRFLP